MRGVRGRSWSVGFAEESMAKSTTISILDEKASYSLRWRLEKNRGK